LSGDLGDTCRLIEILIERGDEGEHASEDDEFVDWAIWVAAVITYRRCFTSGRSVASKQSRHRIEALVQPEEREVHDMVLHLADKHIAHQVSDQANFGNLSVHLMPRDIPGIRWVGTSTVLLASSNIGFLREWLRVALAISARVDEMVSAECDRWRPVLEDRIPWLYAEADRQRAERESDSQEESL